MTELVSVSSRLAQLSQARGRWSDIIFTFTTIIILKLSFFGRLQNYPEGEKIFGRQTEAYLIFVFLVRYFAPK